MICPGCLRPFANSAGYKSHVKQTLNPDCLATFNEIHNINLIDDTYPPTSDTMDVDDAQSDDSGAFDDTLAEDRVLIDSDEEM